MYKVNIIKNNAITNSANFNSQEDAQSWLNRESLSGSFGKIQREVVELVSEDSFGVVINYLENDENIEDSISSRVIEGINGPITLHTLPAEFSSEIIDISNQVSIENESREALAYLTSTDYKVLRHIRQQALSLPTTLSQSEYLELEHLRHDKSLKVL